MLCASTGPLTNLICIEKRTCKMEFNWPNGNRAKQSVRLYYILRQQNGFGRMFRWLFLSFIILTLLECPTLVNYIHYGEETLHRAQRKGLFCRCN